MENYFLLLGLPFDPPETDESKIEAAIKQKKNQWSDQLNSSTDAVIQAKASEYLAHLRDIRAVMLESASREKAAREAKAIKGSKQAQLEQKLSLYRTKGDTLSQEDLQQILKLFGPFGFTQDEITRLFGPKKSQELDLTDILDKSKSDRVRRFLQQLDTPGRTLYHFLDLPHTASVDQLRKAAVAMQNRIQAKGNQTGMDNASKELCGLCEVIFKDSISKRKYDNYVSLTRHTQINDAVDELALSNHMEISLRMKEGLIDMAVRHCQISVSDASIYISNYCAYMGYTLPGDKVACGQCGAENPAGSVNCAKCGRPLFIICPSCGRRCDASAAVCSRCGFKLEHMDRAIALCGLAEQAIESLDFQTAAGHLADADRLWPHNKLTPPLQSRLSEYRQRAGTETLREAVESRRYLEARQQYNAIRSRFPTYSDPALEQKMSAAIDAAQALFLQANRSSREDEVLTLCAQAAALCTDYPGIQELRAKYPPAPPAGFSVKADPRARGNALSWAVPSGGRAARCIVVRSHAGPVQNRVDGKEIFQGNASSYWDRDIEPGVTYWYNVFLQRDGVLSSGAAEGCQEVVNLFEIGEVSVTPGDGSLRLSWGRLPHSATAELYLAGPGGERHHASIQAESFLLTGLTNGEEQRFRIALSYPIGRRKRETAGVTFSAAPVCPPAQVETLRVQPAQKGMYQAIWRHTGPGEVRLFASSRRPGWHAGDLVPLSALEQEMTALPTHPLTSSGTLRQGERGALFRDPGWETLYVTAAAVRSRSAVFGPLARAGNGASVRIQDIRPVNGRIHLFLDAPQDSSGFAVLYRLDRFPADPTDPEAVRQDFTSQQYKIKNALLLESLEERAYYFTVFAWFDQGGERVWSPGAERVFDCSPRAVITYAISPPRGFFGGRCVTLEFQADVKQFTLPDIDVLSAVGAVPMFRASASLLHTIPSQRVEGSLKVKIPLPKGTPKDTYIKPIFRDDSAQAGSQLRLKLRSDHKVT